MSIERVSILKSGQEGTEANFQVWMKDSSPSCAALDESQFAEYFFRLVDSNRCDPSSRNTAEAIVDGLRDWDLFALILGSGCRWPTAPTVSVEAGQSVFPAGCLTVPGSGGGFTAFPSEVLLQTLPHVPLHGLLALWTTSRGFRRRVQPLLNEALLYQLHHGDLGWILPVPSIDGETIRAFGEAQTWIPAGTRPCQIPFDPPSFPLWHFISECFRSDSMRNRRRLWGIYKQYQELWEAMEPRETK
ncbi:hypothetical protein C8J57DRAFT_1588143 [Mycena rebaudengoi]|nr:hypothetical protein C8J57DRAFT_1588143 [Mycena rebaudengoi]